MKINKQNLEQDQKNLHIKKKVVLVSENEHYFFIFGKFHIRDFHRKSIKNAAVGTQTSY